MKRVTNKFFFLCLAAVGCYYLYNTDNNIRNLVSDVLSRYSRHDNADETADSTSRASHAAKKERERIPKTIKPDKFYELDEYARKTPKRCETNIETLATYLVKPASTDIERVRLLFTWVATHVAYDDAAFNTGNFPDYSAENVLKKKKAVCEGYSNILDALCKAAGFKSEKIIGYAKGYSYRVGSKFSETNHAWNAIKVDNTWRLFDATWASGYGTNKNGKLVSTSRFDPYWFDVNPKAFIFTHFPEEAKWQLIDDHALTLAQYQRLPYIHGNFFKLGFDPVKIYDDALSGKVSDFVDTYKNDYPINVSQLPYSKKLNSAETNFEIQSAYAEQIALVDDQSWHYFEKDGDLFTITHKPAGKKLKVCVKVNWFDQSFQTLLEYKIVNDEKMTEANSKLTLDPGTD
jgi:hypothetical protein